MKSLSDDDKQASLLSFIEEDAGDVILADRSTLERYAACPFQAVAIESGRINGASSIASSGQEVHDAFSLATNDYIDSRGMESPRDIAGYLESCLRASRPDVQPDVLAGARATIYAWSKWLHKIHPENILHYDGGEGERSGQLAWDISFGRSIVRVTSELDFVYAGASPKCLHVTDYKSGHKIWTAAEVKAAFQFQTHAALLFEKYPDIDGAEFTIWNTRINSQTFPTTFLRKHLGDYQARIKQAAAAMYRYRSAENPPTWPALEKCSICDAAGLCPIADEDVSGVAENPGAFVDRIVAVDATLARLKKLAAEFSDKNGDIEGSDGVKFGRNKPRSDRKAPAAIYTIKGNDEGD